MRYIVLDGFYPWVRGGCIACSRGQGGLQCGGDAHPSKQSYPTHSRNSATALLLGQSVTLDISCVHRLWDSLVSNSCLYTLRNACFRFRLIEWYGVSLIYVCVILAPFLASTSACSFPLIWQCPGIHCSAICLYNFGALFGQYIGLFVPCNLAVSWYPMQCDLFVFSLKLSY